MYFHQFPRAHPFRNSHISKQIPGYTFGNTRISCNSQGHPHVECTDFNTHPRGIPLKIYTCISMQFPRAPTRGIHGFLCKSPGFPSRKTRILMQLPRGHPCRIDVNFHANHWGILSEVYIFSYNCQEYPLVVDYTYFHKNPWCTHVFPCNS